MSSAFSALKRRLPSPFLILLLAAATAECFAQQPVPDLAETTLEELGNIKVYSASKHL